MKKKYIRLIAAIVSLALGTVGFLNGFNSPDQWRQSFAIVGFIILFAISLVGFYVAFKKQD